MVLRFIPIFKLVTKTWTIIGENNPVLFETQSKCVSSFISALSLHEQNLLRVRQWLERDTEFCKHISVAFLEASWFFNHVGSVRHGRAYSLAIWVVAFTSFFVVKFVNNLQLCVKRYWFTIASHRHIRLLIENYIVLNSLAIQSKVRSLSNTIVTFKMTCVLLVVAFTIAIEFRHNSAVYNDWMLLGPKNNFALSKFSLYKFRYIPGSLLW